MAIDPKKGGKCWSCQYCEDIATQDDNPSGSYYRKCTKSGREYIDTCCNYCSDYVWTDSMRKILVHQVPQIHKTLKIMLLQAIIVHKKRKKKDVPLV